MPGQGYYKLRPSGYLTLLFVLLCIASLVSVWMLPLSGAALSVISLVVLWCFGYRCLLDANLRMGHSCVAFRLESGGGVVLILRDGRHIAGRISDDSLVIPYLVILNVVPSDQSPGRHLLLSADVMGKESFRLLRTALRWGDQADQAAI